LSRRADAPNATREFVSRWENGKRIPIPYWCRHLSAALGIPLDVLDRAAAVAQARRAAAKAAADHQTGAERTLGYEGPAPLWPRRWPRCPTRRRPHRSGDSARVIGYSPTAAAVLVVILVHREDKPGAWWGGNGWHANSTDRRTYRERTQQ
jgi:hypothetical protein